MEEILSPSRGLLNQLRQRLKLAISGKEMLERKRDALIRELEDASSRLEEARRRVLRFWEEALFLLELVRSLEGSGTIRMGSALRRGSIRAFATSKRVMGARYHQLRLEKAPTSFEGELLLSSIRLDELLSKIDNNVSIIGEYLDLFLKVQALKAELKKTNRRIGSIERKLIAPLKCAISSVVLALEERERGEVLVRKRLKKRRGGAFAQGSEVGVGGRASAAEGSPVWGQDLGRGVGGDGRGGALPHLWEARPAESGEARAADSGDSP